jgi:hypothetical protein
MATRCKALRKPTEQPVEQWYASLAGKVPTKYLSKGCGYGFQKNIEKYALWTQIRKKTSKKSLTEQYCNNKTRQNAAKTARAAGAGRRVEPRVIGCDRFLTLSGLEAVIGPNTTGDRWGTPRARHARPRSLVGSVLLAFF